MGYTFLQYVEIIYGEWKKSKNYFEKYEYVLITIQTLDVW